MVQQMHGAGMSTRQIAAPLGIGNKTVARDLATVSNDTVPKKSDTVDHVGRAWRVIMKMEDEAAFLDHSEKLNKTQRERVRALGELFIKIAERSDQQLRTVVLSESCNIFAPSLSMIRKPSVLLLQDREFRTMLITKQKFGV
jgi:hypothetical protein